MKNLKKAEGCISQNVVDITMKDEDNSPKELPINLISRGGLWHNANMLDCDIIVISNIQLNENNCFNTFLSILLLFIQQKQNKDSENKWKRV